MNVYEVLSQKGLSLPQIPPKGGIYASAKKFGENLIYVSGCGPSLNGEVIQGKLGAEFTLEDGYLFAHNSMLNVLAALESLLGDLNKVISVVKITTFVAGSSDFYAQSQVANGGTQLLLDLFGKDVGIPCRSAVGVNALPGNMPVETEAIFEVHDFIEI